MLSAQTTKNLADAFHRAAITTLVRNTGDDCNIVSATGSTSWDKASTKLLMVTISSFSFRLVTLFEVSRERPTQDYYTGGGQNSLDEVFAEVANMCCGALGRELSSQFKHLAMSIPYGLDSQCAEFLNSLQPCFKASYDITINSTAQLRTTMCMCCKRPFEFAPSPIEVCHEGGELELF